ncbi:hypothetical protein Tco_0662232 [Tanacetum coccineum]
MAMEFKWVLEGWYGSPQKTWEGVGWLLEGVWSGWYWDRRNKTIELAGFYNGGKWREGDVAANGDGSWEVGDVEVLRRESGWGKTCWIGFRGEGLGGNCYEVVGRGKFGGGGGLMRGWNWWGDWRKSDGSGEGKSGGGVRKWIGGGSCRKECVCRLYRGGGLAGGKWGWLEVMEVEEGGRNFLIQDMRLSQVLLRSPWNGYLRKGRKTKPKQQNRTRNGKAWLDIPRPGVWIHCGEPLKGTIFD